MDLLNRDVNERLSRLLARASGGSITLTGRDGDFLRAVSMSLIHSDSGWREKRVLEDFLLIEPIKGNIGIEAIREIEAHFLHRPSEGQRKYLLILQCERMTIEASNALLKILEEPPRFASIIMTTTSWNSLLPTVRSRSTQFNVEIPDSALENLKLKYRGRVPYIYASALENFDVLNHFLRQDCDLGELEQFAGEIDSASLEKLRIDQELEGLEPFIVLKRRIIYLKIAKSFIENRDFFSVLRKTNQLFGGTTGFERSRELVAVVRSMLRDLILITGTSSWNRICNIDLIEWLMNYKASPETGEDFLWCDRFLRQRTGSLNSTLVFFRAAYALRRSFRERNGGK